MRVPDHEKPGREAALKSLLSKMGGLTGKKLAGLKKPAPALATEGSPAEEAAESPAEEAAEGGFCPHCGQPR